MSASPMYILGVIIGLLLVIGVAVAIFFATGQHKRRPGKFDERQTLARLKAFRAAFWTLIGYLALNGVYVSATGRHWGDAIVEPFAGICIAVTLFAILCIFYDAYFALNERRSYYLWLFGIVAGGNGVLAALNIGDGRMITDGVVNFRVSNLIVFVMFLILFVALIVKAVVERRAKAE